MLVVAVAILAGVVAVASGRGGEMAVPEPDYPPIDLGPVSAADVALLRPPSAAWGYNMRVTDEALEVIARAVTERDVQIAALQQQVSDLREQAGGGWPAEAGSTRADEPEFPVSSPAVESEQARGDLDDTVPPAYPEYPDYLEYPEYSVYREPVEHQSELDDPLAPADPGPGAAAEPGAAEPGVAAAGVTEPGVTEPGAMEPGAAEDAAEPGAQPAQEPVSEADWPGEAAPHVPGSGSGPAPPVAITRPQPIYRHPAGDDATPSGPSAPWGPAQPPGEAVSEAPPAPETPPAPEPPVAAATPSAPDDHGWGTDPADTSPDAKPLDWTATAPASTAAEPARPPAQPTVQPSAPPPAEPEPTDWDGRSQPSPAPSVWDVASRQVDADQGRPAPSPVSPHAEFIWDEDPHQTVVWGAEHARAKAARTADETLPNAEQRDERG
jgi:hypothetical protein